MRLKEIIQFLEQLAPPSLQENYDNSGLITGNPEQEISGAVVSLDCIEDVVEDAIRKKCNLIIAHHPIVFSGLKSLTGRNYIERTVIKAIRNDIAIYAIHTNLDNVHHGVNQRIAEKLGLTNTRILSPKRGLLKKLVVYVPDEKSEAVREALFHAGAGHIGNYDKCSFNSDGTGTFRGNEDSDPAYGEAGELHREKEQRVEVIVESWKLSGVISAMTKAHPYEEVAYDIYNLDNVHQSVGAGMVGELPSPEIFNDFLAMVSRVFETPSIRYTKPVRKDVVRVALCGGSGSFLLENAKATQADVFLTADFKYHQFFDAESSIAIVDIGHYESEQFTIELLIEQLREKFTNFALHFTDVKTNPVNYYTA